MPDLDVVINGDPTRVFTFLHDARPVLLNLGARGGLDEVRRPNRIRLVDATYDGEWKLPALGTVTTPIAVLIRPDGYVAWVGEQTHGDLEDALTTWFGPR